MYKCFRQLISSSQYLHVWLNMTLSRVKFSVEAAFAIVSHIVSLVKSNLSESHIISPQILIFMSF